MPKPSDANARQRPDLAGAFEQIDLEMNRRGYISTLIMPALRIDSIAGTYRKITIESLLAANNAETARNSDGTFNQGNYKYSNAPYNLEDHGWVEPVDRLDAKMMGDNVDLELLASQRAFETVLNNLEGRTIAAALTDVVAAGQATAATAVWSDFDNAVPVTDVFEAAEEVKDRIGMYPNVLAISRKQLRNLKQCQQIIDHVRSAGAGSSSAAGAITLALLAEIFDVDRVVVSNAQRVTSNMAKSAVISSLFPDNQAWLGVVDTGEDIKTPCFGRTLVTPMDGAEDSEEGIPFSVETWYDIETDSDKTRVRFVSESHTKYIEAAQVLTGV